MKNKKTVLYIILVIVICIVVSFLSIEMTKLYFSINRDEDYKKLGLEIDEYDIEYCTIYTEDFLDGKYKVYKIKNYNTYIMDKFESQLEESDLWDRNKYYEYIMKEFSEIKDDERIHIDRDDLYYYNGNNAHAIFDLKNAESNANFTEVLKQAVEVGKQYNANIDEFAEITDDIKERRDVMDEIQSGIKDLNLMNENDEDINKELEELEQGINENKKEDEFPMANNEDIVEEKIVIEQVVNDAEKK